MKQEYYLCLMSTKCKLIILKQHFFRLYYTNYIYPGLNNSEFHSLYQGFSTSALLTFGLNNSSSAFTVHCRILATSPTLQRVNPKSFHTLPDIPQRVQ